MTRILFYVTLSAFAFGQVARIQFPNGIAVSFLDLSVGLFIACWLIDKLFTQQRIRGELLLPILLFFVIGFISLLMNSSMLQLQHFFVPFLYGLRWLVYALLFFAVQDFDKRMKHRSLQLFIGTGGAVVIIGFAQYFFYNNLRNLFYLQWDDHLYRMFSTFLDPNFAGVFFSLFLFLTLSRIADTLKEKDKRSAYIFSLLSLLTLLAVILTYSRTALITLGVGIVTFLFLKGNRKLTFLFLLIAVCFLLLFSNVGVEGRNPFRTASSQERIRSIQTSLTIIEKNPIFGVGFNAYRYAQNRYGFRTSEKWQVSHADAGTDNSWLFVLATTGVVGFLAYGFLWIRVFRVVREVGDVGERAMVMATLAGFLASSLFLNTLFYPMLMYWMWVLLGVTESKKP